MHDYGSNWTNRSLLAATQPVQVGGRAGKVHWKCGQPRLYAMQIRVLFFGVLKELVGRSSETIELPEGSTVETVLRHYSQQTPRLEAMLPSLALSVNHEYSGADWALRPGDEVALLPPVSGGSPEPAPDLVEIVRERITAEEIVENLKMPEDGAAVIFDGVVRNQTRGRRTLYLEYEAYEAMALKKMKALAEEARSRFSVRQVGVVHRLGRLEIGETSVLIVVTAAHRGPAFEACRWIIDTLKKTVPIWKKEYFEDGAVWADGEPFPEEIRGPVGTTARKPASK